MFSPVSRDTVEECSAAAQTMNSSEKVEPGLLYILHTMHLNREGIEWYRSAAAFKSKMGQYHPRYNGKRCPGEKEVKRRGFSLSFLL